MSRTSVVVRLTNSEQPTPEGVAVRSDSNRWTSPEGGWLSVQSGVWDQLPDGLHLMDSANKVQVAICNGCNFYTSNEGDTKDATFPSTGGVGNWAVIATTP